MNRPGGTARGWRVALVAAWMAVMGQAHAATIELNGRQGQIRLDSAELERHPEARDIAVSGDISYGRDMRYRAVPLAVLLQRLGLTPEDTLEVVALDGFVAQLPGALVLRREGQPWLAIEPAGAAWPILPGKAAGAGPFYIVWPDAAGVKNEQWPYAVARLNLRDAPALRWPQLTPAANVPEGSAIRRGKELFVVNCLACHRLNGGGEAQLGPDLNWPMSPVEYFQPQALRQLIRSPSSVRHWPSQGMPAFGQDQISDAQLDDLLAYLGHMARERKIQPQP